MGRHSLPYNEAREDALLANSYTSGIEQLHRAGHWSETPVAAPKSASAHANAGQASQFAGWSTPGVAL